MSKKSQEKEIAPALDVAIQGGTLIAGGAKVYHLQWAEVIIKQPADIFAQLRPTTTQHQIRQGRNKPKLVWLFQALLRMESPTYYNSQVGLHFRTIQNYFDLIIGIFSVTKHAYQRLQ